MTLRPRPLCESQAIPVNGEFRCHVLDAVIWAAGPFMVLLSLTGLGDRFVSRSVRLPVDRSVAAAIVGILVVAAAVPIWNLVLPLGTRPAVITIGLGLLSAGVALWRGRISLGSIRDLAFASVIAAAIYRATSLVIPIRFLTDTVVYHLPHMEWLARSALPFGTANIQVRLGFNPGFMTLASAYRWEPLGHTHLFVLEVAVRALFLLVVLSVLRRCSRSGATSSDAVRNLTISVVIAALPFFAINKSGTDGNVGFLVLAAVVIAFATAQRPNSSDREGGMALVFALVGLVSVFKLSAATSVLLFFPILAGAPRERLVALFRREHRALVAVTGLAVLGWSIRSFATTGCLAFPIAASCTTASWGVGADTSHMVASHVTEFARRTELSGGSVAMFDLSWVSGWIPTYLTSVPALVVLAAVPVAVIGWARGPHAGNVYISQRKERWLRWSLVIPATLPIALTVLSIANLLGGRRFLGVDPSRVGVLEDYPYLDLLLALPPVALTLLLCFVALAPRHAEPRQASTPSAWSAMGPLRALVPFLIATAGYWLLAAPAVRFSWALHTVIAALLLSSWIATVDLSRFERFARSTALVGFSGAIVVIVIMGLVRPVAPLRAPDVEPSALVLLAPENFQVFIPPDIDSCSTLFPCAPTEVEGVRASREFGRWFFRADSDARDRVLTELGIEVGG